MMKNFESIITSRGLVCACILHSGSVGEGIIEIAKENKVTLIVMGTRGQNKIRRTFLGSSSDYCLHQSGLPVTVIPDPNQTSQIKELFQKNVHFHVCIYINNTFLQSSLFQRYLFHRNLISLVIRKLDSFLRNNIETVHLDSPNFNYPMGSFNNYVTLLWWVGQVASVTFQFIK